MDGSSRSTIVTGLVIPNGITLDYDLQTLYWADAGLDRIEKANVDGSHREILITSSVVSPHYIDYYDGALYWSDGYYNRILSASINSPSSVSYLISNWPYDIYGTKVVKKERQREG